MPKLALDPNQLTIKYYDIIYFRINFSCKFESMVTPGTLSLLWYIRLELAPADVRLCQCQCNCQS